MIVMAEWKPKPESEIQKVWVEYITLGKAASAVGVKKGALEQILRAVGKYETRWVTIYSNRGAAAEGKPWGYYVGGQLKPPLGS